MVQDVGFPPFYMFGITIRLFTLVTNGTLPSELLNARMISVWLTIGGRATPWMVSYLTVVTACPRPRSSLVTANIDLT